MRCSRKLENEKGSKDPDTKLNLHVEILEKHTHTRAHEKWKIVQKNMCDGKIYKKY